MTLIDDLKNELFALTGLIKKNKHDLDNMGLYPDSRRFFKGAAVSLNLVRKVLEFLASNNSDNLAHELDFEIGMLRNDLYMNSRLLSKDRPFFSGRMTVLELYIPVLAEIYERNQGETK